MRGRFAPRFWSVRHARLLETIYGGFERGLVRLAPWFEKIGWGRIERPVAAI
ncbi:MAG: methylenetetrahydrofolate reductase, partial [Methylobacteriaceae bacterium]|nr:methylenetetrahydrofolate reductase [Methylobacteriaceae bacterium]